MLSQTYDDIEYILVDGASSDGTIDIIRQYQDKMSTFVSEPDNGIYDGLNKGIALATGDVIGFLHSDDFYASDNVIQKVAAVFNDPAVDTCYGDLRYVDAQDTAKVVRFWRSGSFESGKFYWGWMPPHPTFFVRRSIYDKYGLFNLNLGSAADYEIMLRFLLKHQLRAAYLPEVFVNMRVGGVSNASLKNRLKANQMDRKAWEVNNLKPYPWTLSMKPLRKVGQWFIKK